MISWCDSALTSWQQRVRVYHFAIITWTRAKFKFSVERQNLPPPPKYLNRRSLNSIFVTNMLTHWWSVDVTHPRLSEHSEYGLVAYHFSNITWTRAKFKISVERQNLTPPPKYNLNRRLLYSIFVTNMITHGWSVDVTWPWLPEHSKYGVPFFY